MARKSARSGQRVQGPQRPSLRALDYLIESTVIVASTIIASLVLVLIFHVG